MANGEERARGPIYLSVIEVSKGGSVECTQCHGFMAKERLYDLHENDGQVYVSEWRWAYRCIAYGKVSDWAIQQNRRSAAKTVTAKQRKGNARNEEAGTA